MKNTFIILAEGFEEIEAVTVIDILRRLKIRCDICGLNSINVKGAHGVVMTADYVFSQMNFDDYDVIILPGGMPGADNLKSDKRLIDLLVKYNDEGKLIAAICAAPIVLKEAGLTEGRKITSFPSCKPEFTGSEYSTEPVIQDANMITGRGPGTAAEFAFRIADNITAKDAVIALEKTMLYDIIN
ncbi:MAG: DJ-1 family glyoxalase III [Saccharofermentanales bacterium]